jgi:molybdate transport system regulatory protein
MEKDSAKQQEPVGGPLTMRVHLWLEREGSIYFGIGRALLIEKIEEYGSLRRASQELNMSYRAAWGKIKAAEEAIGAPLVQKVKGKGQRYELSPLGRELNAKFRELHADVEEYARDRAQALFQPDIRSFQDAYPDNQDCGE